MKVGSRWRAVVRVGIAGGLLLWAAAGGGAESLPRQPYEWKNVAIGGGGFVPGLVFHPEERDLLYARTDVGGTYRWEPAEERWIPLNDDLGRGDAQLTGILSLALDRQDPDRVYLAAGQYLGRWARTGAILRSADRGLNWERTELPIHLGGNADGRSAGERLQVDPRGGSRLFLGTNQNGLWRSEDRGVSWAEVTGFAPRAVTFVCFGPSEQTVHDFSAEIYVGTSGEEANLWRSQDGGATWAAVPGGLGGHLIPRQGAFDRAGVLYLACSDALGPNGITTGEVWKFDPAWEAWAEITPPGGQGGWGGISVDPANAGTVVVSTMDRWWPHDEIYRSTDGGETWRPLLGTAHLDHVRAPHAAASTPHWIGDLDIDPHDPDRMWFVTGYGLYRTTNLRSRDSGDRVDFSFINEGLEETVPLGLVSPPEGPWLVSAVGDIDGFRHDDLEKPPEHRHQPERGTSLDIAVAWQSPLIFARTHRSAPGFGQYSIDGARTWIDFASAPAAVVDGAEGPIAVTASGSTFLWSPRGGVPAWSDDRGQTWHAVAGLPLANVSLAPDREDGNWVHAIAGGRIYRSEDAGRTFAQVASGVPFNWQIESVPGVRAGFWLYGNGRLRVSSDGGVTTEERGPQMNVFQLGFGAGHAPGASASAYIWAEIGGVIGFFRSDDGGHTWVRINDARHQFGWCNRITGDPRVHGRVYIATGGRGILYGEMAGPVIHPEESRSFANWRAERFNLAESADPLIGGRHADPEGDGWSNQWHWMSGTEPGAFPKPVRTRAGHPGPAGLSIEVRQLRDLAFDLQWYFSSDLREWHPANAYLQEIGREDSEHADVVRIAFAAAAPEIARNPAFWRLEMEPVEALP